MDSHSCPPHPSHPVCYQAHFIPRPSVPRSISVPDLWASPPPSPSYQRLVFIVFFHSVFHLATRRCFCRCCYASSVSSLTFLCIWNQIQTSSYNLQNPTGCPSIVYSALITLGFLQFLEFVQLSPSSELCIGTSVFWVNSLSSWPQPRWHLLSKKPFLISCTPSPTI